MKYRNSDDNRYRVRFMVSTEELMDALTVKQFISYLEENTELEDDEDVEYIDGKVVKCRAYDLKEADSNLHKEFLVTEDGRVFYWLALNQRIELVDDEKQTEIHKQNVKRQKMTIVFSQIMKGFATKEEVAEEIDYLIETEDCPYDALEINIKNWAFNCLSEDNQKKLFSRFEKYEKYL